MQMQRHCMSTWCRLRYGARSWVTGGKSLHRLLPKGRAQSPSRSLLIDDEDLSRSRINLARLRMHPRDPARFELGVRPSPPERN
ncbi:hypothetical protein CALCODRAFT_18055 [Calocera cornea HHB12733]|uniref:Uncharacterized protein n=1 Tax=Calocera cornea HHB12733 TaxID=1353952 RepID=A0A165E836_9BASI|nr:hypothetical protein CALCODRAFT_18055 [Calocera cornea HHB12733]